MKQRSCFLLFSIFALLLTACIPVSPTASQAISPPETTIETAAPTEAAEETTVPETAEVTTVPETTQAAPLPEHSPLYIADLDADSVIAYFEEVCLAAEYTDSGNPSVVQKWTDPIYYSIEGTPTEEDIAVLEAFTAQLNTIDGFPGIYAADLDNPVKLEIFFCDQETMRWEIGTWAVEDNLDGAVTFHYNTWNRITDCVICVRNDLPQYLRNSVLQEELYNGLGPVQDTELREDSLIYQGYSEPQSMSAIDLLILQLLYHPDIQCGMNAEECAQVIRSLYY